MVFQRPPDDFVAAGLRGHLSRSRVGRSSCRLPRRGDWRHRDAREGRGEPATVFTQLPEGSW